MVFDAHMLRIFPATHARDTRAAGEQGSRVCGRRAGAPVRTLVLVSAADAILKVVHIVPSPAPAQLLIREATELQWSGFMMLVPQAARGVASLHWFKACDWYLESRVARAPAAAAGGSLEC